MPEYTVLAVAAVALVVLLELRVLRTGLLRTGRYWGSMAIVLFFMVLVDGWLTKLSAPIVLYNEEKNSGARFPWDIPVEDFAFGFGMVTLAMVLWVHAAQREERRAGHGPGGGAAGRRQEQRA